MKKSLITASLLIFLALRGLAQDTLPGFSVKNIGSNRIVVSWINRYPVVKQISIQRSFDSLINYKTILSVPDPMATENGFADLKAPSPRMFYRLFIVFEQGAFVFSPARRPVVDSTVRTPPDQARIDKISLADSAQQAAGLPANPTLNGKNNPNPFVPSMHVFTYKDGNVRISLPENSGHKYNLKFFGDDNSLLFEIHDLRETPVLLDKANFYHAGWFHFELYEDGKLIEKNKFYLAKPF
ncbi:MAG TPA: hypothetical protein VG870_01385 [Chitinophagaceae bacterium]|nr:hypothetical protein [Chitinophagaceae bacterium]